MTDERHDIRGYGVSRRHFLELSFLMKADGTLLVPDHGVASCLGQVFGYKNGKSGLPPQLVKMFREMVSSLGSRQGEKTMSKEVSGKRPCRMYVTRDTPAPDGADTYRVTLNCQHEYFDLSPLAKDGFSKKQIAVLDLLQKGANISQIAEATHMSRGNVKYHLQKVGEKLHASGKTEIVARAIARSHELQLLNSMS